MAQKAYSLSHTKWKCKYHIVFSPKYRRKVIYNQIRKDIGEILRKLCQHKRIEIIEGHLIMRADGSDGTLASRPAALDPSLPLCDARLHAVHVEHTFCETLAHKAFRYHLVVLLEVGDLGGIEQLVRVFEALRRIA